MRKFMKYTVLAGCMAVLGACQETPFSERDVANRDVTILARMGGGLETRTCVDGSSPEGVTGILWSPGDCIGVYGTGSSKNLPFVAANTANAAEASFSGSMTGGDEPAYAYYPYGGENDAADVSAVRGTLKLVQTFDMSTGRLESDYKVGVPAVKGVDDRWEFDFEHLFSLLRFDIDASGTALEGDNLEQIILTLPDGRRLGGEFTFDLATALTTKAVTWTGDAAGANVLTMAWSDEPALTDGAHYTGYMTCAPDIRQGDEILITILTRQHKAEFRRTALVDFAPNSCYTFPLVLENYTDVTVTARPVISSFSFTAADNGGKILATKLVAGSNGTTSHVANTEEVMSVDGTTISGCIPYLYDFRLKPSFTVADGLTVTVDGKEQISGQSEQDFSQPVVYTVSDGTESRDYTVTVTNSGLPVVVLTQSGGGTEPWDEAGISVRSKDSEWVESDRMAVYNADGTVDVEAADCGVRLRGNSTQGFPKKPFAIKLASKAAVLGMPKHKRWVLLANWMDRTMLRNAVALEIAHRADSAYLDDGIDWSPRGCSVEVVMDGRHVGNYYLCEQIKIDGDRVDIRDCYEDVLESNPSPTMADCGYLLEFDDNFDEVDKFPTDRGLPCMFKDEVTDDNIQSQVQARIEAVEQNLEDGNYTAAYADLDINSVIDYFLIQELTFNDEYKHPKSVYMLIDGEGKLTAGPVWDFDWQTFVDYDQVVALNAKYGGTFSCRKGGEWLYGASKLAEKSWPWGSYDYENDMPYMWYPLLFRDATFRAAVQERWPAIHAALLGVEAEIDRLAEQNRLSDRFNQAMWPLASTVKSSEGAAYNGDEDMSFDEAVASLKKAFTERLSWMNTAITGGTFVTDAE